MRMTKIPGSVTAAIGFSASACRAGIKYRDRTDMAMIFSNVPCAAAGAFTSNLVKAAPVLWDREIVSSAQPVRAVVVNSGIANAGTGAEGMRICEKTAEAAGRQLGIPVRSVLIGSTGVIGTQLPIDRLEAGVGLLADGLGQDLEHGTAASRAIMTTDTVNKEIAFVIDLPNADGTGVVPVTVGGMSKGSGMIHPNMCTMLAYITTDCDIGQSLLQKLVSRIVEDSFNMISVDGDTSTNDTLLVLANGQAGNQRIMEEDENCLAFAEALRAVCRELAMKMAADGEGATHLIESTVVHMDTKENARALAKSVVCSSLVKAMVFGKDANCGRVLCALGYAGPAFDPERIEIRMLGESGEVVFFRNGAVCSIDEELALHILSEDKVRFLTDMRMGEESATAWGCDLTYDYVKINGDYRT